MIKQSVKCHKAPLLSVFFNCYLAAPLPTLGHSQGDSITNPMLITAFYLCRPEGHREPRNEVGPLSPAERPAGFESGNFRFKSQRFNPLGHSTRFMTSFIIS